MSYSRQRASQVSGCVFGNRPYRVQTFDFFKSNLVTEYDHAAAVADGVNVGHEVYRIRTRVTEGGAYNAFGDDLPRLLDELNERLAAQQR